jgi:hypothetical protein
MNRKITSISAMLLFTGIVCGQTPGSKSNESIYVTGDCLADNDLYENFESWPPAGWTFIGNHWFHGETGTLFFLENWTVGGVTTPPGGLEFVAMNSGYYPDTISWMISPSLIIGEDYILSFWAKSMPGPLHLEIRVSQSDNSVTSFTECIGSYSFDDFAVNPWIKYTIDLSKFKGKIIYIAWKIVLPLSMCYSMIDMVRVGPQPISDAALILDQPPDYVPAGELDISGTILNQGSGSITQADVSWQVDDGPDHTERFQGFSVAEDSGYQFVCHDKYVTSIGNHTLIVKISQVNGLGIDQNQSNDTVKCSFYACSNSTPRMHLFEVFTSSTCGCCPVLNKNVVEPATQKYIGKVAVVKYQMNFPGSGDKYYISENGIRGEYYGIGWVPVFYINGITSYWLMDSTPQEVSLGYIDDLLRSANEQQAVVEIKSKHTVFQVTGNIEINVTITPYFSGTGYNAFVCVVEKVTTGNVGGNGETEFYSVLMKMLPDAQGIPMNFVDGIPENIHLSSNLSGTHIEELSDLAVVLFIQDMNTHKVIQAAYSENAPIEASKVSLPEDDIMIYPNPSNGILNICGACDANLEIYDILGRVLFTVIKANCNEGLDLAGLEKGPYLLKIRKGGKTTFHKIMLY